MKELWIAGCICAVILAFVFIKKYRSGKCLYEKVSWCMTERQRGSYQIYDCIWSLQYDLPDQYKLKASEEQNAAFILDVFQEDLSSLYFHGKLSKSTKVLGITREGYFFLSLCSFLDKRECGVSLNEREKYVLLEKTSHGMWGTELYDAKYQLTDFGIVYTKLLYYAQLYCESNRYTDKFGLAINSDHIKARIDCGKIEISVM